MYIMHKNILFSYSHWPPDVTFSTRPWKGMPYHDLSLWNSCFPVNGLSLSKSFEPMSRNVDFARLSGLRLMLNAFDKWDTKSVLMPYRISVKNRPHEADPRAIFMSDICPGNWRQGRYSSVSDRLFLMFLSVSFKMGTIVHLSSEWVLWTIISVSNILEQHCTLLAGKILATNRINEGIIFIFPDLILKAIKYVSFRYFIKIYYNWWNQCAYKI